MSLALHFNTDIYNGVVILGKGDFTLYRIGEMNPCFSGNIYTVKDDYSTDIKEAIKAARIVSCGTYLI